MLISYFLGVITLSSYFFFSINWRAYYLYSIICISMYVCDCLYATLYIYILKSKEYVHYIEFYIVRKILMKVDRSTDSITKCPISVREREK